MLIPIISMLVIGLIATAIISLWNRTYNGRV
jgi:hypothetical protein